MLEGGYYWLDFAIGFIAIGSGAILLARPRWRPGLGLWLFIVLAALPPYLLQRDVPHGWSWGFIGGLNIVLTTVAALVLVVPVWRRRLVAYAWGPALLALPVWGMFVSSQLLRHNPLAGWSLALSFVFAATLVWIDLTGEGEESEPGSGLPLSPGRQIRMLIFPAIIGAILLPAIQIPDDPTEYWGAGFVTALLVYAAQRVVRRVLARRRAQRTT